ncbi:MAG TPA: Stp1/IreP family PP2C-type Ser/Thr phosphatase [Euzebyales bacterium]|nr:Stp1/IreP family PP2C-type Ser/Thr phosphatase [Euzebyales bacterium]
MRLSSAAGSHVGLIRPQNEDSYLCEPPLYVVADGLGGHAAGEVASALVVERLGELRFDEDTTADAAQHALTEAVRDANRRIHHSAAEDPQHAGMGTTVTAAVAVGETLCFAHVGDSRGYLLRGDGLSQITEDHTPVQRAVRAGVISAEEALHHPSRHVLAQAVGLDVDVEIDTPRVDLQPGDRVVLCTDGMTDPIPDADIPGVIGDADTPEAVVEALITAALQRGGPDNVTIVVIDVAA